MTTSTGQEGTKLLEVHDLSLNFDNAAQGKQIAIDQVSFSIAPGSTLGLIGASGSGKSSIARCILQLLKQDAGNILFDGQDMATMTARQLMLTRRRMQIVFQEPSASLSPRRTIAQILLEPLHHFSIGEPPDRLEKARQTLQTVGLDHDVLQRFPHQFSSGQQQRIAIARALVTSPDLLIADEAVSSLDVSVQAQILQLIKSLQQTHGIAFLFISHDLGVVRQVADNIAVMYQGQLLEQSPADMFFNQPAHPYSRKLVEFSKPENTISITHGEKQLSHGRKPGVNPPICLYAGKCAHKVPICEHQEPKNHELGDKMTKQCVKCHLYDEVVNNDN
jgi:ABC-type oligopeptide transport system ATPase subunit